MERLLGLGKGDRAIGQGESGSIATTAASGSGA
jgi:hypothetical protein